MISDRLKEVRDSLGISQQAMAEKLGVSLRSQQNYEAGSRTPDAAYLAALTSVGVDLTWLLTGVSNAPVAPVEQLTVREKHLLANYRGSDDVGKRAVETTASAVANRDSGKQARSGK